MHAWRDRHVDAVLSVGPLECMPNKLAESQLVHVGEAEGLLSLTVSTNGDPVDPEPLDAFAFEVHARFRGRAPSRAHRPESAAAPGTVPAVFPEEAAS